VTSNPPEKVLALGIQVVIGRVDEWQPDARQRDVSDLRRSVPVVDREHGHYRPKKVMVFEGGRSIVEAISSLFNLEPDPTSVQVDECVVASATGGVAAQGASALSLRPSARATDPAA